MLLLTTFVLLYCGLVIAVVYGFATIDRSRERRYILSPRNPAVVWILAIFALCLSVVLGAIWLRSFGGCDGGYKDHGHCTKIDDAFALETAWPQGVHSVSHIGMTYPFDDPLNVLLWCQLYLPNPDKVLLNRLAH